MSEIWKDIEGYEGFYQVSDMGRVKSLARMSKNKNGRPLPIRERILSIRTNEGKHIKVTLSNESYTKDFLVHILVARHFISNPNDRQMINHIDHDPTNNNDWNLEWTTMRENVTHGLLRRGSRKKTSKYPGVSITKINTNKKWRATVYSNGRHNFIGNFYTEEEAHEAYKKYLDENSIDNKYAKVA